MHSEVKFHIILVTRIIWCWHAAHTDITPHIQTSHLLLPINLLGLEALHCRCLPAGSCFGSCQAGSGERARARPGETFLWRICLPKQVQPISHSAQAPILLPRQQLMHLGKEWQVLSCTSLSSQYLRGQIRLLSACLRVFPAVPCKLHVGLGLKLPMVRNILFTNSTAACSCMPTYTMQDLVPCITQMACRVPDALNCAHMPRLQTHCPRPIAHSCFRACWHAKPGKHDHTSLSSCTVIHG